MGQSGYIRADEARPKTKRQRIMTNQVNEINLLIGSPFNPQNMGKIYYVMIYQLGMIKIQRDFAWQKRLSLIIDVNPRNSHAMQRVLGFWIYSFGGFWGAGGKLTSICSCFKIDHCR